MFFSGNRAPTKQWSLGPHILKSGPGWTDLWIFSIYCKLHCKLDQNHEKSAGLCRIDLLSGQHLFRPLMLSKCGEDTKSIQSTLIRNLALLIAFVRVLHHLRLTYLNLSYREPKLRNNIPPRAIFQCLSYSII